jgi:hypothetical protein
VSVALVVTHANRTRCILLSSVASLVRPYFSTLSHKEHDLWKNVIENGVFLIFSTTFETSLILRQVQRDVIKMYIGLYVRYL